MKRTIVEGNFIGKKVIVRVDYNVPVDNGKVIDGSKIDASLKTINYLIAQGSKIILMSHFGKVKDYIDASKKSLKPIYEYLSKKLDTKVLFSDSTKGEVLENHVNSLKPGQVLLMENTRFEDLNGKLESKCDIELSKYWASLADVFVFDAFGSSHRKHASTVGIAKYLESYFGFLMTDEIDNIDNYIFRAKHPFTIVLGGAKVDDKILMIKELLPKCDHMLIGGGIANTFLKVLGYEVGKSLVSTDEKVLNEVAVIISKYSEKLLLPADVVVTKKHDSTFIKLKSLSEVYEDDVIMDIGFKTVNMYKDILINFTQTLFINGTVGYSEDVKFANGTKEIFNILKKINVIKIAGGGDVVAAINKFGYANSFTYLSTGGGATLDYISTKKLPIIEEINKEIECL